MKENMKEDIKQTAQQYAQRMVNYANNNKRLTYYCIIGLFGLIIVIVIAQMIIDRKKLQPVTISSLVDSTTSSIEQNATNISTEWQEYNRLNALKEEFDELLMKEHLTRQDSNRILEIYEELSKQ